MALRITLNAQEAEDVVQDTLLKVWSRRSTLDAVESVEAYATTICRNIALDHLKRRERFNLSLDDADMQRPDTTADPLQQLSAKERMEQLHNAINALPEKQRTCMQLRDFEGKSYREIATILNITEEQVKVNIFRARKAAKAAVLGKGN